MNTVRGLFSSRRVSHMYVTWPQVNLQQQQCTMSRAEKSGQIVGSVNVVLFHHISSIYATSPRVCVSKFVNIFNCSCLLTQVDI